MESGFRGHCKVTRYDGGWGTKDMIRWMSVRQMIDWMNKHNYKLTFKHHLEDGRINMSFYKEGCKTNYGVVYYPE